MTFKDFLTESDEHKNGTYVSVHLSPESSDSLFTWVKEHDIENPTPKKEYHCTIVYSRVGIPTAKKETLDLPFTAIVSKWEIFPTQTGAKCLVARLDCPKMKEAFKMYHSKYAATYDYDEYKPHVTVSYDYKGELPDSLPHLNLVFDKLEFKPLDPDWKASD